MSLSSAASTTRNLLDHGDDVHVHAWAMADMGFGPDHPIYLDVSVYHLPAELRVIAGEAIKGGELSFYCALDGNGWVSRTQLAVAAGFGRRLYDPTSVYFVPQRAMMKVPYRTDMPSGGSWYQNQVLRWAASMAHYLSDLRSLMPPHPFDLHVHQDGAAAPIRDLVQAGKLPFAASDCGWWVSAAGVQPHLPEGESLDEPSSAWFVGPHDRADHDEVDRLSAEHRQWWPEVYDEAGDPLPSRRTPSL